MVLCLVAVGLRAASAHCKDDKAATAVRNLYVQYDAAWNQGDVKALLKIWADEAKHVEPDGRVLNGRAAIDAEFGRRFASEWKGSQSKQTVEAVQFVKPDVALVDASYEVTGARDAEGKPLPPLRGRYLDVWVKKAGKWRIVADRPLPAQPAQ
jgi:uncharacterized protein (TIGR02246 family)